MPLFEDERWEVVPRVEENVFRGEDISVVGYLIDATRPDGSSRMIVDQWGIGGSETDRAAAVLFCVAKDMFNSAETLAPVLQKLRERGELDASQEDALEAMLQGLARVDEMLASRPEKGSRP